MADQPRLPGYVKYANKFVKLLARIGIVPGGIRVVAVPGRKSGKLRSTPVAPFTLGADQYVVAGLDRADWVLNARAAGWGTLTKGRKTQRISLVELPVEERGPILREFPVLVPQGVEFFTKLHGVSGDPDEFAGLADKCPVFRIEPQLA